MKWKASHFLGFAADFLQDRPTRYPKFRIDFLGLLGLIGQARLRTRFIAQWIALEKRKERVTSVPFWFFSSGRTDSFSLCHSADGSGLHGCLSSQLYPLFKKPFRYL